MQAKTRPATRPGKFRKPQLVGLLRGLRGFIARLKLRGAEATFWRDYEWNNSYAPQETEKKELAIAEFTRTSSIFLFVDDIAVRVRPAGKGAVVDLRSKSRLGRGDLGANAAHIRALRDDIVL